MAPNALDNNSGPSFETDRKGVPTMPSGAATRRVLNVVTANPTVSNSEIASLAATSTATVSRVLRALRASGRLHIDYFGASGPGDRRARQITIV